MRVVIVNLAAFVAAIVVGVFGYFRTMDLDPGDFFLAYFLVAGGAFAAFMIAVNAAAAAYRWAYPETANNKRKG